MKIVLLVAGGRGGSDFFQGLLDNHKQILQFPGHFLIDNNFYRLLKKAKDNKFKETAKLFLKVYPYFFNSKLNKIERHDKLGPNKNRFYTVDKDKFINYYIKLSEEKKNNRIQVIENLHLAYYLARGKKISNIKIIFIHTHLVSYTKKFLSFTNTKNFRIIHAMKGPMPALSSPIMNWLNFKNGKFFFPKDLYFQLDIVFKGITDLLKLDKNLHIVQLENLQKKRKRVMRDFCKIYKIKFEKTLLQCTYFGFQWWGDQISSRWVFNKKKNVVSKIKEELFFKRDLNFFEYLALDLIKFYNYEFKYLRNRKVYFNLLPMKCELLVWKNTIKHKKIIHIISIPFFYLKRIIFINKFFIKFNKLPYSIGF